MYGYGAGSIPQTQGYGGGGGDVASFLGGQDAQRQAMLNYMYKGNVSGGAWAGTQGSSGGGGSTTNNTTYNMSTPTTINNPAPTMPTQQNLNTPNVNLPDPSAQKKDEPQKPPQNSSQRWDSTSASGDKWATIIHNTSTQHYVNPHGGSWGRNYGIGYGGRPVIGYDMAGNPVTA